LLFFLRCFPFAQVALSMVTWMRECSVARKTLVLWQGFRRQHAVSLKRAWPCLVPFKAHRREGHNRRIRARESCRYEPFPSYCQVSPLRFGDSRGASFAAGSFRRVAGQSVVSRSLGSTPRTRLGENADLPSWSLDVRWAGFRRKPAPQQQAGEKCTKPGPRPNSRNIRVIFRRCTRLKREFIFS